jgi:acetyl esterase/lipase
MKKVTFLLLVVFSVLLTRAQQQYVTVKGLHYYADSTNGKDAYTASQCILDLYYPKNVKNFTTIVWFHGGSLTGGAAELPKALMDKGYAIVGVNYRLSPKVNAPAYIEDAAAAVAWTFQHIGEYGGDTRRIVLSGHSAGGYLVMMVTLDKSYLNKYHIDANDIAEVVPFSGQAITHFTIREERGIKNTQPIIDHYAPLYFVRPDAPPMLLITGDAEKEMLGRYEENAYLWRMMKLAGHTKTRIIQLKGYDHGGMAAPAFPILLKELAIPAR